MQSYKDSWHFICCDSMTLNSTQQGYSTYNLKLLGTVYALKSLHHFVSSGLLFTGLTNCTALNNIQEVDINSMWMIQSSFLANNDFSFLMIP